MWAVDWGRGALHRHDPPDARTYGCETCVWRDRLVRRCDERGDGAGREELLASRALSPALQPRGPDDPALCALLRLRRDRAVVGWLAAYPEYKEGTLPRPGGMLQQDARYVEAMRLMRGRIAHHDRLDREEAREEAARK